MNKTGIPYLDYTWNPIAMKCTPTSPSCQNCWHLAMARRLAKNPNIAPEIQAAYAGETGPLLVESRLDNPSHRKKPSVIGLQFMGDLFHEDVPADYIKAIINIIRCTSWHTYLILTKRPERALELTPWLTDREGWSDNVALGTTVEDQSHADKRIPTLLQIPARWHWISYEPALSAIDFSPWTPQPKENCPDCRGKSPVWPNYYGNLLGGPEPNGFCWTCAGEYVPGIDAIVCGCESGPGARPMDLNWARSVRDQCLASEVSFYFKQAKVDDKVISMPELDGKVWDQLPWRSNE